eukprot:jgi/Mesvir1/19185/Mv11507-RA.1
MSEIAAQEEEPGALPEEEDVELAGKELELRLKLAEEAKPSQTLSVECIADRNLPEELLEGDDGVAILAALTRVTHVRLDRERISSLGDALRFVPAVTNLYLQYNRLVRIGPSLPTSLRFLTISHNQLTSLEGVLVTLPHLKFLDLSHNRIFTALAADLPPSLAFLRLEGNPCCDRHGYPESLVVGLPGLLELDGVKLTNRRRKECYLSLEQEVPQELLDVDEGNDEEDEEEEEDGAKGGKGGEEGGGGGAGRKKPGYFALARDTLENAEDLRDEVEVLKALLPLAMDLTGDSWAAMEGSIVDARGSLARQRERIILRSRQRMDEARAQEIGVSQQIRDVRQAQTSHFHPAHPMQPGADAGSTARAPSGSAAGKGPV